MRWWMIIGIPVFLTCTQPHPIKVLIFEGQSINHPHWPEIGDALEEILHPESKFEVYRFTMPGKDESLDGISLNFKNYDVVVSTYDGDPLPLEMRRSFEAFVAGGGGFVALHAADNAFGKWEEYNLMIGVGGWGGRGAQDGYYLYYGDDGERHQVVAPEECGHHGDQHAFLVESREPHPITDGLPDSWLHVRDELYDQLCGPAENLRILATAFADTSEGGTGRHEPVLMTVDYQQGRVFHSTLGHSTQSMSCAGFITTFLRGCEWAATGEVTIPVPDDFPTAEQTSMRK